MKGFIKKAFSVLTIIVIVACIGVSIPGIIKMVKDITAKPDPNELLTLVQACDYYGQVVEVEGRLELPRDVTCTTENPSTCRIELYDPYWRENVYLEVPVYNGSGRPPVNHMASLPEEYTRADFYIPTSADRLARDGSFISVRGTESGGNPCVMSGIESIEVLDRLVVDVGIDLQSLTLREAITDGLVVATINGGGLFEVQIALKPKVEQNYEIIVEPGTMLISGSDGVQNMVVREEKIIYLKENLEVGLELDVSCANMHLDQPEYADAFSVSPNLANEDLVKLLGLDDFPFLDLILQQFAIWTITDNPTDPYGYVAIDSNGSTRYPTENEIAAIKDLFIKAGLDPAKYVIFIY